MSKNRRQDPREPRNILTGKEFPSGENTRRYNRTLFGKPKKAVEKRKSWRK